MTAVSEVVIAGAGIAGLSAGIALARNGIQASIYDAAPKSALEGSGLTVSAIGMRAIRDLGLGQEVAALGAGASETIIADAAGHQLDKIASPPLAGADLPAMGGIMRATFHDLLLETANAPGCRRPFRKWAHRARSVRWNGACPIRRWPACRNTAPGRRRWDLLTRP